MPDADTVKPTLNPSQRVLRRMEFEDLRISEHGEYEFVDTSLRIVDNAPTKEGDILQPQHEIRFLLPFLKAAAAEKKEFVLTHDSIKYRCARTPGQEAMWFSMRRINETIRAIEEFEGTDLLMDHIMEAGSRSGLILACGATGSGKTELLSSLTKHFVSNLGGFAVTLEDPVEKPLEGKYVSGPVRGRIIQISMPEEQFHVGLKDSLRRRPRFIYLGELRTQAAAITALHAASTGHTVLTTIHGGSPTQALLNLVSLAAPHGRAEHYWQLLASTLQMVVCMERDVQNPIPYARILAMPGMLSEEGTRSKIREANIETLNDDMEATLARARRGFR